MVVSSINQSSESRRDGIVVAIEQIYNAIPTGFGNIVD
jgi:hypothetical protein